MKTNFKPMLMASLVTAASLWGGIAYAAAPYVNATVEGALTPGVYGRIDIGSAPPPPLIYAQPVIIYQAPVVVEQQPLYLHVPPGHAKKWSKHCAQYNACGLPVYFVRVRGDEDYESRKFRNDNQDEYRNQGEGKHGKKDKKHGKGRDGNDD
ncbi:MAG: hypothetical protein HHJ16_12760 [Polaromonas sp.]|uniref:hypothetical protein n=1 Tax=Polaromonas sp. TaxID=1869339 RepID=UPI0018546C5A|nr:hypothetical protein [Polaromonas sp.]NMM11126.1 hypothetical protein [Polaromonas sp.]